MSLVDHYIMATSSLHHPFPLHYPQLPFTELLIGLRHYAVFLHLEIIRNYY